MKYTAIFSNIEIDIIAVCVLMVMEFIKLMIIDSFNTEITIEEIK